MEKKKENVFCKTSVFIPFDFIYYRLSLHQDSISENITSILHSPSIHPPMPICMCMCIRLELWMKNIM